MVGLDLAALERGAEDDALRVLLGVVAGLTAVRTVMPSPWFCLSPPARTALRTTMPSACWRLRPPAVTAVRTTMPLTTVVLEVEAVVFMVCPLSAGGEAGIA